MHIEMLHRPPIIGAYLQRMEARILRRVGSRIAEDPATGCWIWSGCCDDFGYGRVRITGCGAPRVHVLLYEMYKGKIPRGLIVRHTCDVPACVNPDHLILGTKLDNARDRDSRGRSGVVGERNPHAKLTEDQVREIRRRWTGAWGQASALCREYGVKAPALYAIIRGTGWKHVK